MKWCNILVSAKCILVIGLAYSLITRIMIAQQRPWAVNRVLTAPLSKNFKENIVPIFDFPPTGGIVVGVFKQETKHQSLRL